MVLSKNKEKNTKIAFQGIIVTEKQLDNAISDVEKELPNLLDDDGNVSCIVVIKHIINAINSHTTKNNQLKSFEELLELYPKNLKDALKNINPEVNWEWCPDDIKDLKELYNKDREYTKICNWYKERHLDKFLLPSIAIITPDIVISLLNRGISENGVKKCFQLLKNDGFNNQCRILLNKDDVVGDGQHRLIALFIAGYPFIYDKDDALNFDLVSKRNDATTPYAKIDELYHLQQKGNINAIRYMYLSNIYSPIFTYYGDDTGKEGRSRQSDRSLDTTAVPQKTIASIVCKHHRDFSDFVKEVKANRSFIIDNDEWENETKPTAKIFLDFITTAIIPKFKERYVYSIERKNLFTIMWRIFTTKVTNSKYDKVKTFDMTDLEILGKQVIDHNKYTYDEKLDIHKVEYNLPKRDERDCVATLMFLFYRFGIGVKNDDDALILANEFLTSYLDYWKSTNFLKHKK